MDELVEVPQRFSCKLCVRNKPMTYFIVNNIEIKYIKLGNKRIYLAVVWHATSRICVSAIT